MSPKAQGGQPARRKPSGRGTPLPKVTGGVWHDDMPVPAEYHLTCRKCGYDLTGLDRHVCPKCRTRFHLPIPEGVGLKCLECGYDLTGLTTRICPECGTGFDVEGLRRGLQIAKSKQPSVRYPWYEIIETTIAVGMIAFGTVAVVVKLPLLLPIIIGGGGVIAAHGYARGTENPRILTYIGLLCSILGVMAVVAM